MGKIRANNHYVPKVADPVSPVTFVDKIKAPTFMACQWTDEQTGGHCPTLASRLTGTNRKWITFTNGTHVDSLGPETVNRWYDFLKLYVAREAPINNAAIVKAAGPVVYQAAMGISGVTMPRDPIQEEPTYESALAAFEKLPPVRILFDNGAGGSSPGQPLPAFEQSFSKFPIPGTTARSWYLGAGGALTDSIPARAGSQLVHVERQGPPADQLHGRHGRGRGRPVDRDAPLQVAAAAGRQRGLVRDRCRWAPTRPSSAPGAVQAWVRSSTRNVDLQATISEVRPDGKETFVQGGWLRANERKLDARKSTLLEPVLSLRARDVVADAAQAVREGRRSRSTTRATSTAPARASA